MAAVATPVTDAFRPDAERFAAHCRRLLSNGCDGLTILGTTGAFACFSVAERIALMRSVARAGLPLESMLAGTGAGALDDAVELTAEAAALGFGGVLVVPPFYHKAPSDDGLFEYYAALIERVADARLRLYLYHFPKMSGAPLSGALVGRLRAAYPATMAGLKDSSEDAALARSVALEAPGFDVFPGSEAALLEARRAGYAGCISATVNVTAPIAQRVWSEPDDGRLEAVQSWLAQVRAAITSVPAIAALHALISQLYDDPQWTRLAPPLSPLTPAQRALLAQHLADAQYGFEITAGGPTSSGQR